MRCIYRVKEQSSGGDTETKIFYLIFIKNLFIIPFLIYLPYVESNYLKEMCGDTLNSWLLSGDKCKLDLNQIQLDFIFYHQPI